jgi:hypothetical protein
MKISVVIYKGSRLVGRRVGNKDNWRKIYGKLASAVGDKYLVRVEYGYDMDIFGKRVMFDNEYIGNNLSEAKQALAAFIE